MIYIIQSRLPLPGAWKVKPTKSQRSRKWGVKGKEHTLGREIYLARRLPVNLTGTLVRLSSSRARQTPPIAQRIFASRRKISCSDTLINAIFRIPRVNLLYCIAILSYQPSHSDVKKVAVVHLARAQRKVKARECRVGLTKLFRARSGALQSARSRNQFK